MTKNKSFNNYEKIIFLICILILNIKDITNKIQEIKKEKQIKQTTALLWKNNDIEWSIMYKDINNNIYTHQINHLDIKYNIDDKIDIFYNLQRPYDFDFNKNKLVNNIDKELSNSLIFRIIIFIFFFILYFIMI